MTDLDLGALRALAEDAASSGGAIVRAHFGEAPHAREKAPGDWVSDVDMASERAVRAVLQRGAPDIPVFGEEEGGERGDLGWLVDPLDGTANFLHRFPMVGVSVGLVRDGRPIVGVVQAPILGHTFTAVEGGGAHRDGEAIHVSARPRVQAIMGTGFPFRRKDLTRRYLRVFGATFGEVEDLRRAGAASLDLCWTASGVFDGYFELALGPWDVAAGSLIVREAGGVVTDWEGDDRAWLDSGNILAGGPIGHAALREIVESAGRD